MFKLDDDKKVVQDDEKIDFERFLEQFPKIQQSLHEQRYPMRCKSCGSYSQGHQWLERDLKEASHWRWHCLSCGHDKGPAIMSPKEIEEHKAAEAARRKREAGL